MGHCKKIIGFDEAGNPIRVERWMSRNRKKHLRMDRPNKLESANRGYSKIMKLLARAA